MASVPTDELPSLSVILPCHDEAENVVQVAREAVRVARAVARRIEVVVVDDGSGDDTAVRARALADELAEIRVVRNPVNRGYGGALRQGFDEARMDWVFYTDGDGQLDLEDLSALVALLGNHDMAVGYRERRNDPPWRIATGRAWTALTNAVLSLGVRDVNCAFKIFPRALLEGAELTSDGALIGAELLRLARRRGYSIAQMPVRHRPRRAGRQSGGDPRVMARAFLELTRLLLREAAASRQTQTPSVMP